MPRRGCAIPKLGYSSAKQGVDGVQGRSFNVLRSRELSQVLFLEKYGFRSRRGENRLGEFINFHVKRADILNIALYVA